MTLRHYLPAFILALVDPSPGVHPVNRTASYYHDKYEGTFTSSGERFWHAGMTCASNDFPIGTWLYVTYRKKTIRVRVNDRMSPKWSGIRIDLSQSAFRALNRSLKPGLLSVNVTTVAH